MKKKWKDSFIIGMVCLISFLCFLFSFQEGTEEFRNGETKVEIMQIESRKKLEQFGVYFTRLLEEGKRKELESLIISRTLTWEEGAEFANYSPVFSHFSAYGAYQFDSDGIILTIADLNEDGREDMIEYLPRVGHFHSASQYMLVIYMSNEEKNYEITYYQPNFDAVLNCYDKISVVSYQENQFLILELARFSNGREHKITVYQIQEGKLIGRFEIEDPYQYDTIYTNILFCEKGMEEKAKELKKEEKYYMESAFPVIGNAEEPIQEESKEAYLLKQWGEEEEQVYQEKYEKKIPLLVYSITRRGAEVMYQSDLDHDGEKEFYAKKDSILCFTAVGYGKNYYHYLTGELYGEGKHEGKRGLEYIMGKNGERIDWEALSGLDIWATDWTPCIFWVEKIERENIIFMKYYNYYNFMGLIEGYRIQEGSHEVVLSVEYRPSVDIFVRYEQKSKEEQEAILTYMVCMEEKEDTNYPQIYGLQDRELEKKINQELEGLLRENREVFLKKGMGMRWTGGVGYNVVSATKEKLLLNYVVFGELAHGVAVDVFVEIDLKSGVIQFVEDWNLTREYFHERAGW